MLTPWLQISPIKRCNSPGLLALPIASARDTSPLSTRLAKAFSRVCMPCSPRLDLGIELGCFPLADQVGGGGCVDQDLLGHHPTELSLCRVLTSAKGLGEHSDQTARELHKDLRLLFRWEDVHHSVHGLRGGAGVQGPKTRCPVLAALTAS